MISLNVDLKKIIDSQAYPKNFLVWGTMAVVLALAAIFYFPIQKKCDQVNRTLAARKAQIQMVKASGINLLSPSELARFQKETNDFNSGFIKISQVAGVLNSISEEARKNHLKVISINSEEPEHLKLDVSQITSGQDQLSRLNRLPIKMRLEASYQAVANFLATLNEKSTKKFVVESFHIQRSSSKSFALDCSMTLSFFAD